MSMSDQTLKQYCETFDEDPKMSYGNKCLEDNCKFAPYCGSDFHKLSHLTVDKAIELVTNKDPRLEYAEEIEVFFNESDNLPDELKKIPVALGQTHNMIMMTIGEMIEVLKNVLELK